MVLFAIVGELGAGKTLTLTYLAWHNWFSKARRVYSNYTLYGIPYTRVSTIKDLDSIKEGFCAFDELWLSISSWTKNKQIEFITTILLKSRKRGLTIAFTTQTIGQINRRIREVTDFIAYPIMSAEGNYCRVEVFRGPNPTAGSRVTAPIYYDVEPVIAIFNTYEEAQPFEPSDEVTLREEFNPITKNPGWIRYLRSIGITSQKEIEKYSMQMMKRINPEGITSESQRETADGYVV